MPELMLLRQKKSQGDEKNWCVVLNPIKNEIDKKKVAQKLAQVFTLSQEEAADLVENTPIIILDNLSQDIAARLRDYFQATGADTQVTNDIFQKRKCYRTVWPEPPNLAFLADPEKPSKPAAGISGNLAQEINPFESDLARPGGKEDLEESRHEDFPGKNDLSDEMERLRMECQSLRDQAERLRGEIDKQSSDQDLGDLEEEEIDEPWLDEDREREIREARLLLSHAEEKFETLKGEYREARLLYEEKIAGLAEENDQTKKRLAELSESLRLLQQSKRSVEEAAEKKNKELLNFQDETRRLQALLEQKTVRSSQEREKAEHQLRETAERAEVIRKAKEELELAVNQQAEQIGYWREKHDVLTPRLIDLEKALEEARGRKIFLEEKIMEYERVSGRQTEEFETRAQEIREWEARCLERDRANAELRETAAQQEKIILAVSQQLENRERELETARRQLREVHSQMEHREAIQKKNQLVNQLVDKETLLKKLVKDQESLEREIREREESMRRVLSEQEKIEKEILEGKQLQRYWTEQTSKKEKPGRVRISREPEAPMDDPGDTPQSL